MTWTEVLALLDQVRPLLVTAAAREEGGKLPAGGGPGGEDRLMLAKEAAKLLGIGESTLQVHASKYPFTRLLPGGQKRFSYQGIQAFLRGEPSRVA